MSIWRDAISLVGWLAALVAAVLVLNLGVKLFSLPGDGAFLVACLPLVVAFAVLETRAGESTWHRILRYGGWFYGGFAAILATAFLLSRMLD